MNNPILDYMIEVRKGHLFPSDLKEPVYGTIRITKTIYNELVIIDDNIAISGSPWYFRSCNNFIDKWNNTYQPKSGEIWDIFVEVAVKLHIENIPYLDLYCVDGKIVDTVGDVSYYQQIHFQNMGSTLMLSELKQQ